ncbi:YibE/F family protein [Ruminiclostridium cellobioparum]|uniref:YibE/F family protein n=1 Tax=Ruminiclostridium cellobioparum TaxID=29355 RepID=UPI0004833B29|nr:YibE/F family protein [Ruminiclostridium cellobioparum]
MRKNYKEAEYKHNVKAPVNISKISQRGIIIRVLVLILFLGIFITAAVIINRPDPTDVPSSASRFVFVPARVIDVLYDDAEPDYVRSEGRRLGKQELKIEILGGVHKGEILQLTNYLSALANVDVHTGDRIIVRIDTNEKGILYAVMYNYDRSMVLGVFILVFMLLLVAIGGKKGAKALLGLIFTLVCIWFILMPLMMRGFNSILITSVIAVVTTTVSLLLLDGFTRKAVSAVLGCTAGVAAAGIIAALVGYLTPFNGFNMSDAESLILNVTDKGMKISGLLVSGVLIAALGAVMDVAMSIASSVNELYMLNHDLSLGKLFVSGMNIGRDAMGTMANTLILAFVGSSLNTLILTRAYDIPFIQLINSDYIGVEVIQGVAGSIGIILTVPLVAFISSWLMTRRN